MLEFLKQLVKNNDEDPIGLVTLGLRKTIQRSKKAFPPNVWQPLKIYCCSNYKNHSLENFVYFID